ncbi:MAG: DUF3097 family protein [Acidimicrobiales bacterium]|nr:DUF3097 family protein [Acidimicrobiales bacterium]MCB1251112.1 DUF3097 family protein [Acidimicrobiales bacterium]MCB1260327.1 DUF3097 family protein [Acidimicrobiales bacterium]
MDGPVYRKGILSEPLDLDAGAPRQRQSFPKVEATPGLAAEARGSGVRGVVVRIDGATIVLRGRDGRDRTARLVDGGFTVDGRRVTLVPPRQAPRRPERTASGSVPVPDAPARIARASRILVEGRHDAELVEKVWGDDLRYEGVVVEPLDGADNLGEIVRRFGPRPGRRLGILLDHLVDGSKESRIAAGIDHPDVLVTGHPFVDIWSAIDPTVVGVRAWPDVPKGEPWKEGICRRLGVDDPPRFWQRLLGGVSSYADLDPTLVGAVERLIDFVTTPAE